MTEDGWKQISILLGILLIASIILHLIPKIPESKQPQVVTQPPPDYYTQAPGIDLSNLDESRSTLAISVMNEIECTCGCGLSIAKCRNEDPSCVVSIGIGNNVVRFAEKGYSENETKSAIVSGKVPEINVSVDDDPFKGPEDAPVTIVEFSDYQCPYCKIFFDQTFNHILTLYEGNVKFVYRDFPLGFHQYAQKAAEAAECADDQGKFWEYHDKLFQNQETWSSLGISEFKRYAEEVGLNNDEFNRCLDNEEKTREVKKDLQDGRSYGVTGTPTFYINGRKLSGAASFSNFVRIIETELKESNSIEYELPDYAYKSQKHLESYLIARKMPEVLDNFPCYCGCDNLGHKSLKECFIEEDGSFEVHGAYCQACMDESLDVNKWYGEGLSFIEIKNRIDDKYGSEKAN